MIELKTLNDLEVQFRLDARKFVRVDDLKQEAIKWVKEDMMEQAVGCDNPPPFLQRWMERLNITEHDLK